jgi:GNAT superfamily N-acetyltransferase
MSASPTRCGDPASSAGLTELRRPEPLDPARHDRSRLDSGEAGFDEWLRRYAGQSRRRDTAATWVIADAEGIVVAYASLAMTGVDRSAAPDALTKGAPDPVPALLIGRLAVDRASAGLGVGTALVAYALATAVELNATAACRAVVVTSLNARARSWWERFGFHPLDPDDSEGLDLYLLTADIEATLRRLR